MLRSTAGWFRNTFSFLVVLLCLQGVQSTATGANFSPIRVNAAGAAHTDGLGQVWSADTGFTISGDSPFSFTPPAGADLVYGTGHRSSNTFQFTATVPNAGYAVRLLFADPDYSTAGQRRFNVTINGTTVASNVDVAANAGGQYKPWDLTVPVTVTGGSIGISFVPVTGKAIVSGVEIVAATRVNAAGPGYTDSLGRTWSADAGFAVSADSPFAFTPPAGTELVYSTGHRSSSTIQFTAAVANASYIVRMLFADPDFSTAGQRIFNVAINGTAVASNVDVAANAGGQYKPWDLTVPVTAANGTIAISFVPVTGRAIVSGIDIVAQSSVEALPHAATLTAGQSLQLVALLPAGAATGVSWGFSPSTGNLSSTGLYTAPSAISAKSTVTVTATRSDNGATATSTLTLSPAAPLCGACAIAFDPAASHAFQAGNNAQANFKNCGVCVNSANSAGLYATGSAHITATGIQVVGGYSSDNNGGFTPTPAAGAPAAADPYQGVAPPAIGTCLSHPDYTSWGTNGTYVINPGTYCGGLNVSNGVAATFNPGMYVVSGGGIHFGSTKVSGSGVTFYITGTSFNSNQLLQIDNGATVTLSAPTSGIYRGLLFYQDPTISNSLLSSTFAGGANMNLSGALYFPTTGLVFNNGSASTANVAILARTINMQGGAGVQLSSSNSPLPAAAVIVAPRQATLQARQTQQFVAGVSGACNSAVTWSISSAGGDTISSTGLYTAPSSITAQQTVQVIATSQADGTKSATATVTLMPSPALTAMAPASGQQGQVLQGVVISGQYTHFGAGSTVSFGNPGVTASSISVTDATHLTATVSIATGAAPGETSVTVSTGTETASGNLFTVTAPPAILTGILPASGQQGRVLQGVVITGQYTHFATGSTVTFGNPGVTATNVVVSSPTQLTATVAISASAATGATGVTVATGTETAPGPSLFTVAAGTPVVSAILPASGQQGQVLQGVVITGQYTHFAAGSTVTFGNPGVTATNIVVSSPTQLTATVTISASAATGATGVTVATGTETAPGPSLFTVAAGTPVVSAILPASGQQGQVLQGVVITGQYTHFATGSTVTFGNPGVTATNIVVSSPTQLTATVTISASAATGATGVTVATGSETAPGPSLFTVAAGTPVVSAILPASGQQGQVLQGVVITGQYTHFAAGSTVTFGNPGVTATNIVVTSATQLTATATISASAVTGATGVTVATGSETAPGPSLFTVAAGTPVVSAILPANGQQGQTLQGVVITGQYTHFAAGSTVTFGNPGVTATNVVVTSPTQLTATVTIAAGAATGTTGVTVATGSETAPSPSLFTVAAGTPVVSAILPASGQQGQVLQGVVITGQYTHFATGSVVTFGNPGVTATNVVVTSPTQLTATVSISASAATGATSVTVTTGAEMAPGPGLFTVTAGTPIVPAILPASGQQGQTLQGVVITGQYTHFATGSTVTFGNPGVTATNIVVTSATQLTATVTIAASAATGATGVTVATGSETAPGPGLFTVTAGTPVVSAILPTSGQQGQVLQGVVITGQYTHFAAGSTVTFGNPGVTATNVVVSSPTQLTATVTISASAATGATGVTVTTGSETAPGPGLFTVMAGTPVVSAILPTSGQQGQVLQGVVITGQYTHFATGSTVTFGNPDVTATNVVVTSATQLTATVTISASAATGATGVTVATGSETAPGPGLFTVGAGTPVVSAILPTSGQQGQTLQGVVITGQYTHFGAGSTVTFGNPGVTATNVVVTSSTQLTATVTISASAATGAASVTVATGSETAPGPGLFTVASGTPVVSAIQPTSGQQGQTLQGVVITGQYTHFAAGSTVTFGNPGVTATNVVVTSSTQLTATVTISASAAAGATSVTVTTASEAAPGPSLFTVAASTACIPGGPAFLRALVIDHTKVPNTDQKDFPLLVSITDPLLATTANGGHVASANGYDILFALDPGGAGKLDHEIESYNPGTGQIIMWVRIPALSHTADTTIYLLYGNTGIATSQENRTGVWDGHYTGVWHLANGSTLSAGDSTSNRNDGTIASSTATAGQIDGAALFDGAHSFILLPPNAFGYPASGSTIAYSVSIEAWFKTTTSGTILGQQDAAIPPTVPGDGWVRALWVDTQGAVNGEVFYHGSGSRGIASGGTYNDGAWHHVVDTYANTRETLYVDGVAVGSQPANEVGYSGVYTYMLGNGVANVWDWSYFNGVLDEVRVSNTGRSADWIATEYNNQSSPSTFYGLSPESAVMLGVAPKAATLYGGQSQQFTASIFGSCYATTWSLDPEGVGTLTQTGLYTAPAIVGAPQTVTVIAKSQVDPTKSVSAPVTLAAVSVSVSPTSTILWSGQTQQFTVTVTNSIDTTVVWSVEPDGMGTIDQTGLFTPQPNVATAQTVTITVKSNADPSKSASAKIAIPGCVNSAYSYARAVVIDHTKVANTDQTNFPLLVSITDPLLKTAANGGHVISTNGYDIAFAQDASCSATLNHEVEAWSGTTGQLTAWVQIPRLSHTADTTLFLCYGNPATVADQSNKSGVWDSDYKAVMHLDEASGTTVADSTANGNNGAKASATSPGAISAGVIGGAQSFNGIKDSISLPASMNSGLATFSVSFWVQTTDSVGSLGNPLGSPALVGDSPGWGWDGAFGIGTSYGALDMWSGSGNGSLSTLSTDVLVNDSAWHYVTAVNSGTLIRLYMDGQDTGQTVFSGLPLDSMGWYLGARQDYWFGAVYPDWCKIDEFRFSDSVRSADWIATEYNNQRSPSGFYKIYPENAITVSVVPQASALSGLQSQQFTAFVVGSCSNADVTWSPSPTGVGSLTETGLYTAPTTIAAQQTVTVTAATRAGPPASASADVTLMSVSIGVTPTPTILYAGQTQRFTATIGNTANAAVTWSLGSSDAGNLSSDGLYTAPDNIAAQQEVTVTVASQADTTKSATANVTLMPGVVQSPQVSLSVVPQAVILQAGQTQQFTARVTNTANTAVTWKLTPSWVGAIDTTGLYTAPAPITEQQTVTVTATSQADKAKSASATVTLAAATPVSGLVLSNAVAPSFGPSGLTVTLLGIGFPEDTISPANVLVTLQPLTPGTGPTATAAAGAFNVVSTNTRSIAFVIPDAMNVLESYTPYSLSVSGTTASGLAFASLNSVTLLVTPPAQLVTVWPSAVNQGDTVTVGLTGQNTQFVQNVTTASFGPGISMASPVGSGSGTPSADLFGAVDQVTGSFCRRAHRPPTVSVTDGYCNMQGTCDSLTAKIVDYELAAGTPELVIGGWSVVSGPGPVVFNTPQATTTIANFSVPGDYTLQFSVFDGLTWGRATMSASYPSPQYRLLLIPATGGPYAIGTTAYLQAVATGFGNPAPPSVHFTVSGANPMEGDAALRWGWVSGISNGALIATLPISGLVAGTDTVTAQLTVPREYISVTQGATLQATATLTWISPKPTAVTISPVQGQFFYSDGSGVFNTPPPPPNASDQQLPVFTQWFPGIVFNPAAGTIPGTPKSLKDTTRPFQYVITGGGGSYTGSIPVQGSGYVPGLGPEAGVGPLFNFSAVFTGSLNVPQSGSIALHITAADGWMLGIGGGATALSGPLVGAPSSTPFTLLPTVGAFNQRPAGAGTQTVVVNFPAAGTYPFELDYASGGGPKLTLVMTTDAGLIPPSTSLLLTASSPGPLQAGQIETVTIQAINADGSAAAGIPLTVTVDGYNQQTRQATTDGTGQATVVYQGIPGNGIDTIQATAGNLTSNAVTVTWYSQPITTPLLVSAGPDQVIQLPQRVMLNGSVYDSAVSPTALAISWTVVSGTGPVAFDDPSQAVTGASFTAPGDYVLQLNASDGAVSANVTLKVTVEPGLYVAPASWLALPDSSTVSGVVPINLAPGVTLASGTLSYSPASNLNDVRVLNPSTVGSGQIGTLDTTLLPNGAYWVTLVATDSTGKTQTSLAYLTVVGEYKPGRVMATITDLVVPAKGLSLRIQRTYDSLLRSTSSDFGYGWSLSTKVDLTVNPNHDVTFTLNGHRRTFYFTPYEPGFSLGTNPWGAPVFVPNLLSVYFASYTPEPGMFGTLTVPSTGCLFDWLMQSGNGYICYANAGMYNPRTYIYTDPVGTRYSMSFDGTLQSIQDLSGNTLTVTAAGLASNSGVSVPFVRDTTTGRITKITDPLGNDYVYGYSDAGDLVAVNVPGIATPTTYKYDPSHLVTSEIDRRSNPNSSTYDADGRLTSITDGAGNTTQFAYDTSTNTTTVTNPDGGTIVTVSDSWGNPLSVTDPLTHTTTYTYDSQHNVLSKTDPLGKIWSYTYDTNGNQTSATDPLGNVTATVYNPYGGPIQKTDALGNVQTTAYDQDYRAISVTDSLGQISGTTYNDDGTVASRIDGNGAVTQYSYDAQGNVAGTTDALGNTAAATFDAMGNRLTQADAHGDTTQFAYDQIGRLIKITLADGSSTRTEYDDDGNVSARVDALGRRTTYIYDPMDRLIQTNYPDGTSTSTTYDWRGRPLTQTDQASHVAQYQYDLAGQLLKTTTAFGTPDAAVTQTAYDAAGRTITSTDPNGHMTTYAYDDAGRLVTTTNALNQSTTTTFDADGRQIAVTDALTHKTQFAYDARGRQTVTTYADGTTTSSTYDGAGHVIAATDQAGAITHYTFDIMGRVIAVIDAMNQVTRSAYDADGNLLTRTDANGHAMTFTYDALNRVATRTLPGGTAVETFAYNPTGTVASVTDFNGKTTNFGYDSMNRLLTGTPDASFGEQPTSFTYAATGQRATMNDGTGTTRYQYDNQKRLLSKGTPFGTLTYSYDPAGNRLSVASSNINGVSVAYGFDELNRLKTVTDNNLPLNANITAYSYDAAGNLSGTVLPSGVRISPNRDAMYRVTGLPVTSAPPANYAYSYGAVGNRLSAAEATGRTAAFGYDQVYRLMSETITGDPKGNNGVLGYSLDPVGNRLSLNSTLSPLGSQSFTYDPMDRVAGNTYDANGNTLTSGARSFGWDSQNRLVAFNNGSVAVTMSYDGDGNRVAKGATQYLVDENNPTGLSQVVEEIAGGSVVRSYTYGLERIDQRQFINGTWQTSFYGYDAHGDVRFLMDSSGAVTDAYDFDAWGNAVSVTGSAPNVFRYQSEQFDSETDLYYLRARYLDPLTGRFLNVDPLAGQGERPYLYAGADPVDGSDPTGRTPVDCKPGLFFNPFATTGGYLFYTPGCLIVPLVPSKCRQCVHFPDDDDTEKRVIYRMLTENSEAWLGMPAFDFSDTSPSSKKATGPIITWDSIEVEDGYFYSVLEQTAFRAF